MVTNKFRDAINQDTVSAFGADRDRYGSISRRFAAFLIDTAVLFIPSFVVSYLLFVSFESGFLQKYQSIGDPIADVTIGLMWMFYKASTEASLMQATIGKRVMKLFVANQNGKKISFFTGVVRGWPAYLPMFASAFGALTTFEEGRVFLAIVPLYLMILIWMNFSELRQGLHDQVCGTVVVRGIANETVMKDQQTV